jgi:hypothetical protein
MADGDEKDKENSRAVRGILFFGVPSQGMDISSLLGMVKGKVNEHFLQGLRHDSDTLRNQHREFCKKFPHESCKIISFYETEYSPTAKKVYHLGSIKPELFHLNASRIITYTNNHDVGTQWLENERRTSPLGWTGFGHVGLASVGGWTELLPTHQT